MLIKFLLFRLVSMLPLLLSAFNTVLGFVFRTLVIKFVIFFALFFVVQELVSELTHWLPNSTNIGIFLLNAPDSLAYFLDYFKVPQGMTMVLSAFFTRFLIRRIPIIG